MHFHDLLPCTGDTGLAAAQVQVSFPVFFFHYHHFHFITDLQVGKVTEFIQRDQTITFKTNVQNNVGLCQTNNQSLDELIVVQLNESVVINFVVLFLFLARVRNNIAFVNVPIEIVMSSSYCCFHRCSCCRCSCFGCIRSGSLLCISV